MMNTSRQRREWFFISTAQQRVKDSTAGQEENDDSNSARVPEPINRSDS